MGSMHRITAMGYVTRDPELRYTTSGKALLRIGVAVNDRVQNNGEWVDEPVFYDVQVWEKQAERMAEMVHKGDLILVEGTPRTEIYDRHDGSKGVAHRILFPRITFGTARRSNGDHRAAPTEERSAEIEDMEELPF